MTRAVATYRLQLTPGFGFREAAAVVPYLARLGISHVYLSPVFEARAGSPHGYDVTDPTRLREELGGEAGFDALAGAVRAADLSILLDIVPNHMAASPQNPWWRDVLEFGASSPFVSWFAIRAPAGDAFRLKLPILGDRLEAVLDREQLDVLLDDGLWLGHHEHRVPLAPATYALALGAGEPGLEPLPDRLAGSLDVTDRESGLAARAALLDAAADPAVRRALRPRLASLFGAGQQARERLERLLAAQHYELAHWRSVETELPYRRFFEITHLVAIQVGDEAVFEATHQRVRQLLGAAPIAGLRVDHVDGLRDPALYLERLARLAGRSPDGAGPFIVVEKILAPDETLPPAWPVDGTTGYDFLNVVGGWFIDARGHARLREIWEREVPHALPVPELARRAKRQVMDALFPGELQDLARRLAALAPAGSAAADPEHARRAICETTAALDVYRTYARDGVVPDRDRERIERALAAAATAGADAAALAHLRAVLLLDRDALPPGRIAAVHELLLDWQQFTGPVMAKGVEDTALYNDHALLAANEVGGDPAKPAVSAERLHAFLAARTATPHTLNATATHDTKRGEDARARLAVLTREPEAWAALVETWLDTHPGGRARIAIRDELLLLQTLVGIWPLDDRVDSAFIERVRAFMIKAAREAKARTSWREPDADYEAALAVRVARVLPPGGAPWLEPIRDLAGRIAYAGALGALATALIKVAAPGVPDYYQGAEDWHYPLVDPDNRRPVDFDALAARAIELAAAIDADSPLTARRLLAAWRDGRIKTWLIARLLRVRTSSSAFRGEYQPLDLAGDRAEHILAFARLAAGGAAIAIAARWLHGAAPDGAMPDAAFWGDTSIQVPDPFRSRWTDALTGATVDATDGRIPIAATLAALPCALLLPEPANA